MSTRHHSMIVTAWNDDSIEQAHWKAHEIFDKPDLFGRPVACVSEIIGSNVNGFSSFFVGPDGSKEGWEASDNGDEARAEFLEWLRAGYTNGRYYSYVEIQYGDDEKKTKVVNSSDDDYALIPEHQR